MYALLKKHLVSLTVALWLIALPIYAVKTYVKHGYMDFDVFHRAATRAINGEWTNIYNPTLDGASPYRYSPFYLLLFIPLAHFELNTARVIWFLLQFALFSGGIYLLIRETKKENDRVYQAAALALIFSSRFILDSFIIGQTTGLMFFMSALAALAWKRGDLRTFSLTTAANSWLKIGPGIEMGLIFQKSQIKHAWKAIAYFALSIAFFSALTGLFLGFDHLVPLTRGWISMIVQDDQYFDAAHWSNQSIKGLLLRLAHGELLPMSAVTPTWLCIVVAGCVGLVTLWYRMMPTRFDQWVRYYSLGIMAYLLFMPETFKYSMPLLFFPLFSVFLTDLHTRGERIILGAFLICYSLFFRDLYGQAVTHEYLKFSIPLIFMTLLTGILVRRSLLDQKKVKAL